MIVVLPQRKIADSDGSPIRDFAVRTRRVPAIYQPKMRLESEAGFESAINGFADRSLRPLGHSLSGIRRYGPGISSLASNPNARAAIRARDQDPQGSMASNRRSTASK